MEICFLQSNSGEKPLQGFKSCLMATKHPDLAANSILSATEPMPARITFYFNVFLAVFNSIMKFDTAESFQSSESLAENTLADSNELGNPFLFSSTLFQFLKIPIVNIQILVKCLKVPTL